MRKFLLLAFTFVFSTALAVNAAPNEPTAPATTVVRGKVVTPGGILPGAVVKLKSTQQSAVTNAEGEFQLNMPTGNGPQAATVSFAGFEDEEVMLTVGENGTSLSLAKVHFIKVKRNQSLKVYMKTARKQSRKDLRKVRK